MQDMAGPRPTEPEPAPSGGPRRRPLVLAVEDEQHDWLIYGKLLWYNGFDVLHAHDAEEGCLLAEKHEPDLVLADLMLPGMNGLEMCRKLKTDPRTRDIPVVLLTGHKEREYGTQAREAGCVRFLEKPIGPVEVLHAVEDLVGKAPPPVE